MDWMVSMLLVLATAFVTQSVPKAPTPVATDTLRVWVAPCPLPSHEDSLACLEVE